MLQVTAKNQTEKPMYAVIPKDHSIREDALIIHTPIIGNDGRILFVPHMMTGQQRKMAEKVTIPALAVGLATMMTGGSPDLRFSEESMPITSKNEALVVQPMAKDIFK